MENILVEYQIYLNGPLLLYILTSTILGEKFNNKNIKYYQDLGICFFFIKLYQPFIFQLNHQHTNLLEYS